MVMVAGSAVVMRIIGINSSDNPGIYNTVWMINGIVDVGLRIESSGDIAIISAEMETSAYSAAVSV